MTMKELLIECLCNEFQYISDEITGTEDDDGDDDVDAWREELSKFTTSELITITDTKGEDQLMEFIDRYSVL